MTVLWILVAFSHIPPPAFEVLLGIFELQIDKQSVRHTCREIRGCASFPSARTGASRDEARIGSLFQGEGSKNGGSRDGLKVEWRSARDIR